MKGRVTTGVAGKVQSLCSGKDWADGRKREEPRKLVQRSGEVREGTRRRARSTPSTGGVLGRVLGREVTWSRGIVALGLWGHEPSPEAPARCIFQCDLDFQLPQKH